MRACIVLVCLPLHWWSVPAERATAGVAHAPEATDAPQRPHAGAVFAWLAAALSLAAFIGSAIAAHLITLLTASGLSARDAVLVGSLIGPMQVAGRIMEFAFNRHVRALSVGTFAFVLMACALAMFTQVHGIWIVALAFVIPYGWANGVMTIVRGTVPAELFGHRGYGALLGRLARPQFILKAVAPFALTLLFLVDPERVLSPYALFLLAILALIAYRCALRAASGRQGILISVRRVRMRAQVIVGRRAQPHFGIDVDFLRGAAGVAHDEGQRHAVADTQRARDFSERDPEFSGRQHDRIAGRKRQRHGRSALAPCAKKGDASGNRRAHADQRRAVGAHESHVRLGRLRRGRGPHPWLVDHEHRVRVRVNQHQRQGHWQAAPPVNARYHAGIVLPGGGRCHAPPITVIVDGITRKRGCSRGGDLHVVRMRRPL